MTSDQTTRAGPGHQQQLAGPASQPGAVVASFFLSFSLDVRAHADAEMQMQMPPCQIQKQARSILAG